VLSPKPPINTTIQSLPPALLDQLINEMSTLASVYHRPSQTFIGQGRYGADAVQKAAIEYDLLSGLQFLMLTRRREQMQNARENPIAASAASAATNGSGAATQNNAENLLDIDFDGAAPISSQKAPAPGLSGLEGLAGTPQRVESPGIGVPVAASAVPNNMDDLMGVFGSDNGFASNETADIMNGFAGLDLSGGQPPPHPPAQGKKQANEDILGLY
jgi:AP-1 complex subunit beta-1